MSWTGISCKETMKERSKRLKKKKGNARSWKAQKAWKAKKEREKGNS